VVFRSEYDFALLLFQLFIVLSLALGLARFFAAWVGPTVVGEILAGVLLKFGIYGFIRYAMPLFPYGSATLAPSISNRSP